MIRKLSVPDQNADNFLKLTAGDTGCCGDTVTDCQYTASYTQANSVTLLNITEDGMARALPLVISGGATAATVKAAVVAALVAAGYEDDDNEVFPGVQVIDQGATLDVIITGNVVAVSITHSGGTATFDADCTVENQCTYSLTGYAGGTTGSADTTIRINGVNYDIGTVTPGTTTANDVAAAIQADLNTSGAGGTVSVTTTGSGGSQTYNVTITGSKSNNTIVLDGVYFTRSACAPVYV